MAVPIDEGVLSALRGIASKNTRLPKPLLIKVYVSSLKEGEYLCTQIIVVVCLGLHSIAPSSIISQSELSFN